MRTSARYYDGRTSAAHPVTVSLAGGSLLLHGEGVEREILLEEVSLSAPLGSMGRTLRLPGGGKCELADGLFARVLEERLGGTPLRAVHRWESSLRLASVALLLTVAAVWLFLLFGIPLMAKGIAYSIPPETERLSGERALALLDRMWLEPTGLDPSRQHELDALFADVTSASGALGSRLLYRRSTALGANAFALPGGTVVLTDALVELARTDDEIAAVLAHEVGHLQGRHLLRHTLQSLGAGLVVATLTGDVTSVTTLSAAIPTALVEAGFSRDMEREADDAAAAYLRSRGLPVDPFAAILRRLEEAHRAVETTEEGQGLRPLDYFSTHPPTGERIGRLKGGR